MVLYSVGKSNVVPVVHVVGRDVRLPLMMALGLVVHVRSLDNGFVEQLE